jgi:hypothetical protein
MTIPALVTKLLAVCNSFFNLYVRLGRSSWFMVHGQTVEGNFLIELWTLRDTTGFYVHRYDNDPLQPVYRMILE